MRPARNQAIERATLLFKGLASNAKNEQHTRFYAAMTDFATSIDMVISAMMSYPDADSVRRLVRIAERVGTYSYCEEKILNSDELTDEEKIKVIKVLKK